MIRIVTGAAVAGLAVVLIALSAMPAVAEEVPRLTKEEVRGLLGNPDVTIIDVRVEGVQPGAPKIVGAVVEDPRKVEEWAKAYPKNRTLILYCS